MSSSVLLADSRSLHSVAHSATLAGMVPEQTLDLAHRAIDLPAIDGQGAPLVARRVHRFAQDRQRVVDAVEVAAAEHGLAHHFPTRLFERQQMTGEVAAVHRRYVLRIERTQVARLVPVVEVAAIALHLEQAFAASSAIAPPCRANRASRNRAPMRSPAEPVRNWWASCGVRSPAWDLPASYRAAASDRSRSRTW